MAAGQSVIVVGAGVIGLTTAVVLAEAGFAVRVLAKQMPENTTSAAAGAMWGPYLVEPRDRVQAWASYSLRTFAGLAGTPGTGVRLVTGIEASRSASALPPDFLAMLDNVGACGPGELPDGFVTGWRYTVPLIDMDMYLTYLRRRLEAAGGSLKQQQVTDFGQVARLAPVVVNATGMGARELAGDDQLIPIRGQLVIVDNPGITDFFTEDTGLATDLLHLYPHGDSLVLGGVAEDGNWSLEPDENTARAIIGRCAVIDPRVANLPVRANKVGLRPTRPAIRCERDLSVTGYRLLHIYGHGGAGVSLSWGCANEMRNLSS
ncbi:MAG TPA: FAD-dependent oxidoreductase [Streptosporangiaceae bacterium]|nr:FAD-dependent oxidoreductase [Streptosporangiaceae bacterium]